MTPERAKNHRSSQDPIRTVINAKILVAIDKVKGAFGVDYSVVADEGQPYTTRGGEKFIVPQGSKQVDLVKQPNQDLSPFWRSVNAIKEASKQTTS